MKNKFHFRHEIKYYINYSDYLAIAKRLEKVLHLDANAGSNKEYKIRSLYFDTLYNKALLDKQIGVSKREKYRIRYYNDDLSLIKLEKKIKDRGLCSKLSAPVTEEECRKILNGDIEFLRISENPLFNDLYVQMRSYTLRPKVIVDYVREPYVYKTGNVRITFDKSIRTSMQSVNMFLDSVPTMEVIDHKFIVLEVKYDEFLPDIVQDILQVSGNLRSSVSKYEAARMYSY